MTQALQQPPRFAALKPKYVTSTTYNPRHDPDIFDIVVDYLRRHRGEWVHVEGVFSVDQQHLSAS